MYNKSVVVNASLRNCIQYFGNVCLRTPSTQESKVNDACQKGEEVLPYTHTSTCGVSNKHYYIQIELNIIYFGYKLFFQMFRLSTDGSIADLTVSMDFLGTH